MQARWYQYAKLHTLESLRRAARQYHSLSASRSAGRFVSSSVRFPTDSSLFCKITLSQHIFYIHLETVFIWLLFLLFCN